MKKLFYNLYIVKYMLEKIKPKYGLTNMDFLYLLNRDKYCAYCNKNMVYPYDKMDRKNSLTIEHLNEDGPFYVKDGLKKEDLVLCCGSCNSSRGKKKIEDWFKTKYCIDNNINSTTVSIYVRNHLEKII